MIMMSWLRNVWGCDVEKEGKEEERKSDEGQAGIELREGASRFEALRMWSPGHRS